MNQHEAENQLGKRLALGCAAFCVWFVVAFAVILFV